MLLSKQPGDTGVYATATGSRVSIYDLSQKHRGASKPSSHHDPFGHHIFPSSYRPAADGAPGSSDVTVGAVAAPTRLDVYSTFHPRWGYPIRPVYALPLDAAHLGTATTTAGPSPSSSFPPTARPSQHGSYAHSLSNATGPLATAAGPTGFVPTTLSLSCATDNIHFFISGDLGGGGGGGGMTGMRGSGSGWIGACDHEVLPAVNVVSRMTATGAAAAAAGSVSVHRATCSGGAGERSGSAVRSGSAQGTGVASGASTPRQMAVGGGSGRPRLGLLRAAPSQQDLGSSAALASLLDGSIARDPHQTEDTGSRPLDDEESVEVSSEGLGEGSQAGVAPSHPGGPADSRAGRKAGSSRHGQSVVTLPQSSSRHSLYNLSSVTSPRAAGVAAGGAALPEPSLLRPRAHVLGPVSASGWDPRNAATLALGRQDGAVQLLDVEYLAGGADEPTTRGTRGAAHTYRLNEIHCSVVQERLLTGQVTAMDWVPQSHLTVVAARRQDGLGYYAELLDLRSPESAVRYLGAPPEVLGTPFFMNAGVGAAAGMEGDENRDGGGGGGAPLSAGVSPYVLCYGQHVACDPSRRYVASVGAQGNKDVIQLWDLRQTTRPLSQKVFAKVGYTSLCWSMAEALTVVGATESGELRVHSFAQESKQNRWRDGLVGDGLADMEDDLERAGADAFPPSRRRATGQAGIHDLRTGEPFSRTTGSGNRDGAMTRADPQRVRGDAYAFSEDDEDEEGLEDGSTATPSGSSYVGTTTAASSLNGDLAYLAGGIGVGGTTGSVFSSRMKSRSARKSRLPARVPAAAAAWAVAPALSSASRAMAVIDPDLSPLESGSRADLPRLVLLNRKNGELYYQVYDRRGSTVTIYDALPLAAAGPNLFSVEVRHGLQLAKAQQEQALLTMIERCLHLLRTGKDQTQRGRWEESETEREEPLLLAVVRRALSAVGGNVGADPTTGHVTPESGGKGEGDAITGRAARARQPVAVLADGTPVLGEPLTTVPPLPSGGPSMVPTSRAATVSTTGAVTAPVGTPANTSGGGTLPAAAPSAKDYTGIDLLDDFDEEEDGTQGLAGGDGGRGMGGPNRRSAPLAVGPGVPAGGSLTPLSAAASATTTTAASVAGRPTPRPPGADGGDGTGSPNNASQTAEGLPSLVGADGAVGDSLPSLTSAFLSSLPSQCQHLMRGVRPEDAGVMAYLLEVLPLCANLGFPDRRSLAVSRLASGFTTDAERNLRVLEKEGDDREAYALFKYGLVMARHLYGKRDPAPAATTTASGKHRRDGHGKRSPKVEPEPVVVPINQAVPGMLEVMVAEHRERERLGLLDTPLPQPATKESPQGVAAAGSPTRQRSQGGEGGVGALAPSAPFAASPGGVFAVSGGGWPGAVTGGAAGLPSLLPGRGLGAGLRPLPPPGMGGPTMAAAAAMQPAPRAELGALRELFLTAMGWVATRGSRRGAGKRSASANGISTVRSAAAAGPSVEGATTGAAGSSPSFTDAPARASSAAPTRRRHTTVVPPNSQPRKREPQSFFLDGEGIGLQSLQECIERRVCLLTLMDELSEAAELLALYGSYHPLYPSIALELSAAASSKERRRARLDGGGSPDSEDPAAMRKQAANVSLLSILKGDLGGSGSTGTAAPSSPVWQRTVGCTFWLSLALTFVDSVIARYMATTVPAPPANDAAAAAGEVDRAVAPLSSNSGATDGWSMACMPLSEQRRFVAGLLRCYPRLPLPDVIGLATALLLPPRYTAYHLDSLMELMQALVHQQYEYGSVPTAARTGGGGAGTVEVYTQPPGLAGGVAAKAPPLTTSRATTAVAKQQQQARAEGVARLRELMSLTSRCSLLLTAAVEGIGLEVAALQRYVDETTDVQTPLCYAAAFGPTQSSTFRTWKEAYRAILNANGHFMLRSQHDLQCTKTLKARADSVLLRTGARPGVGVGAVAAGPGPGGVGDALKPPPFSALGALGDLPPPPGAVNGALNSMMKRTLGAFAGGPPAVTPKVRHRPNAPGLGAGAGGAASGMNPLSLGAMISASGTAAAVAASAAFAYADPNRTVELRCNCGQAMHATATTKAATSSAAAAAAASSHVRKQVVPCGNPECRQWQTPMCTVCGERMESRFMELPPERSFAWCTVCLHGGHYCHVSEWFAKHTKCPVEDCPCQCCDAEALL